jgi:hypothetical protein
MLANNTLNNIIIFTAGLAVGAGTTYVLLKKKFEKQSQEEIDKYMDEMEEREKLNRESMDEDEHDDIPVRTVPKTEESVDDTEADEEEYDSIVKGEKYVSYAAKKLGEKEEKNEMKKPYVISPDEFGECDYATISLWYYADGVVTNERGKIIRNAEEIIGEDIESHFGEYEDDSVFVRNEDLEIDYEILRDERSFSEID